VGEDIAAGTYVAPGSDGCAWARLSGFAGRPDDIVASGTGAGPQEVTIRASDAGFDSTGCGGWTRR